MLQRGWNSLHFHIPHFYLILSLKKLAVQIIAFFGLRQLFKKLVPIHADKFGSLCIFYSSHLLRHTFKNKTLPTHMTFLLQIFGILPTFLLSCVEYRTCGVWKKSRLIIITTLTYVVTSTWYFIFPLISGFVSWIQAILFIVLK